MYRPIKVKITDEMMKAARDRNLGRYNDRSFMDGDGNMVGFLGEYMVLSLRPDYEHADSYDYDLIADGFKVDVKTKAQGVSRAPSDYYEASVDVNSMHQNTEYYIFCRIYQDKQGNMPHGWVLGSISKKKFLKKARRLNKGEPDGDNGYIVRQDCYNIRYDQLKPLKRKKKCKHS